MEGRAGQTSKGRRGRQETGTNTGGVHGGRGPVEIVREPGEMDYRGTVDRPVLPVRGARDVGTVVFGCFVPGGG